MLFFSLSNIDFFFLQNRSQKTVFCELTKSSCVIITTHLPNELPEIPKYQRFYKCNLANLLKNWNIMLELCLFLFLFYFMLY